MRFVFKIMALASVACASVPALATNSAPADLPDTRQTIWDVQAHANRAIKYKTDSDDVWGVAGRRGDCEDIVLWKRQQLMQLGFAEADLQVLVLIKPKSKKAGGIREGHVVLRVKSAGVVLDNFEKFPMAYEDYMKKHDFRLICEAVDLSPTMRVQDRCRPR